MGAREGGNGDGGGGGENGASGNSANSNEAAGPGPTASNHLSSMSGGLQAGGEAAVTAHDVENPDEIETDAEPVETERAGLPYPVSRKVCIVVDQAIGNESLYPSRPDTATAGSRDEDADSRRRDSVIEILPVGEEVHEQKCAEVRMQVIDMIRSDFAYGGQEFGRATEHAMHRILAVYQSLDCEIIKLSHTNCGKIYVLARYNGNDRIVLQPQGPLLPGGLFMIMISQRWRPKARAKNDPAFRHSSNALHMYSRTKHLATACVLKIKPIRLFPRGASMAFMSQDTRLKKDSMVLGFTSIPYFDKNLWDQVRTEATGESLCDAVRRHIRNLEYAIRIFNQKGMALGRAAINSAELAADGAISFQDFSQSALFPETSDPHSRQANQGNTFMDRANTSHSWPAIEPGHSGQTAIEMAAHFLPDSSVLDMLQKERQSGKGLALSDAISADEPRGKAIQKGPAFQKDQACVALALAAVLRFPASGPTADECALLARQVSRIAFLKPENEATEKMIQVLAGKGAAGQRIRAWKRCADFVVQSLVRKDFPAAEAEGHLFPTVHVPQPSIEAKIFGPGLRVEDTVFRLPEDWKLEGGYSLDGQQLPAVLVKLESDKKGLGLFAGRDVDAKRLVLVYLGELEHDPEIRPQSRMIVKQTLDGKRLYCFGFEDLDQCMQSGPALGPYANAPSAGERTNCRLDRTKQFKCRNKAGQKFIGFPVISTVKIAKGSPYLWQYTPSAGHGKSLQ